MDYIKIENFRCFQSLEIEFAPFVTLLIGDNASGKTTLLAALRSALSSFFLGYSDENTCFIGISKNDFAQLGPEEYYMNEKPVKITFDYRDYIPSFEGFNGNLASYPNATISLQTVKSRTSYSGASTYKSLTSFFYRNLFDVQNESAKYLLPLFASFSTEDIHSSRRLDRKRFKAYKNKPSFGYYECLKGDGLFPYWLERLLVLAEKDPEHPEIREVQSAIKAALGENGCNIISDMSVRPRKGGVYYIFTDGREVEAKNLSDGYRRLVNIVTDLAFRGILLNFSPIPGCHTVTHGTVLIDEIDLHLHPTLQACVIKGLQAAFPCLQFIISTHAPMVMTGIDTSSHLNKVYKMSYSTESGYTQESIQTYGLDASTIIENSLGQIPRDKQVQEQLNELFDLIDDDEFIQAKKKLQLMRTQFKNTLPELAKAETMLKLLEETSDEKDC